MSGLRGSANYIWFETDVLGQGATGAVYKARHKRTGELYAVKTFSHMGQMRPMEVQMREFQVLQKVNHDNVVKLLAIEEETSHNNKVIIMELCTGGSLYNMLEEAKNSLGLVEKEVFQVLGDVAAGLKHLRELGVVHRDIKPGNIMLFNSEDGRNVYKLTDFGAARELDDEEQFMSLYGTEEYLYPDMYARAVLRRPSDRQFDASVDLWSLGVTMFHVMTGSLPFRPFGGRSNKHTMYEMTTQKDPGVICGVQHEAGGPIEYSRELPNTCPLSKGARLLMTPLLAGLMECNEDKMWSFDFFFKEVNRILKMTKIYVFNSYDGNLLHVYLNPEDRLLQFQEAIAKQTDIPASLQDLIFDRESLTDHVNGMTEVQKYPDTAPSEPIYLFYKCDSRESWEFPPFQTPELPKSPVNSTQALNLPADYTMSKTTAGILHYFKRKMGDFHQHQKLVTMAARIFLFILCNKICQLQTYAHQFSVVIDETQKRTRWFRVQHDRNLATLSKLDRMQVAVTNKQIEEFKHEGEKFIRENSERFNQLSDGSREACGRVDEFFNRIIKGKELAWEHISERKCNNTQRCEAKIDHLLLEIDQTVRSFRADKKKRTLSHNEEQIHKFERHKLKMSADKATQILISSCCSGAKTIFRNFAEWFKWASPVGRQLRDVEDLMASLTTTQAKLSQDMDVFQSKYAERLERILSGSRLGATFPKSGPASMEDYVVYNTEDAPPVINTDLNNSSATLTNGTTSNKKTILRSMKGQLVSLKADTDDIKHWLHENTGLLQELQIMVEKT